MGRLQHLHLILERKPALLVILSAAFELFAWSGLTRRRLPTVHHARRTSAHTQIAQLRGIHVKSIFVGNLNFSTSEGALRQLFAAFGSVTQVKIMMDSDTGKPHGFGFVEMASAEGGDKAIATLNGTLLDERALNVNGARPRKQPGGFRDQHADARSGGRRW
jgi:cold-inducible RNA-binding protein